MPQWRRRRRPQRASAAEPSPTQRRCPRSVDRQMPRPARQPHPAENEPAQDVDGDDAAATRVGHERVPAVGMRRGVARLVEAVQHVLARHAVRRSRRRRPRCGRRPRATPTSSTERGSGSVAIDRTTRNASEVDDREPRLGVTGDERRGHGPRPRHRATAVRTAQRRRARRTRGGLTRSYGGGRPEVRAA